MSFYKKILFEIYTIGNKLFSGRGLGKYLIVKIAYDFVTKRIKTTYAIVNGHKMFLDENDDLSLSINSGFEELETNLIMKLVKRGDVVLDIGAHIGYYTLLFAKIVGDSGKVYAFEPNPKNFKLLKKNINENKFNNVVLVKKAVSDKEHKIKFYLSNDNSADNRFFRKEISEQYMEIECTSIDSYLSDKRTKVDFVKMDVQGSEGLAVSGMAELIKSNDKIKFITEFWPYGLESNGSRPADFIRFFRQLGFKIYNIDEKRNTVTKVKEKELINKLNTNSILFTNLLITKDAYERKQHTKKIKNA